jgi:hypothetical protein
MKQAALAALSILLVLLLASLGWHLSGLIRWVVT